MVSPQGYLAKAGIICISISVNSCTGPSYFTDAAPIPVASIVNGIKCELNGFYRAHAKYGIPALQIDPGKLTTIDMTLKVVNGAQAGVGAKASVLPFAGGSIAPSFNLAVSSTETLTTTASLVMEQKAEKTLDCEGLKLATTGLGLRKWLEDYYAEQTRIIEAQPGVGLGTVVLQTDFGVSFSGGAKADILFFPVTVSPSVGAGRDDIQSLRITFRGAYAKDAERPGSSGPHPYFRAVKPYMRRPD